MLTNAFNTLVTTNAFGQLSRRIGADPLREDRVIIDEI